LVNAIHHSDNDYKHKLALLAGILFASGFAYTFMELREPFISKVEDSPMVYLLSGFLVGLGTRLSGGCTSGHGLCGLPRLSPRSITAVFVFLIAGIITASYHLKQYIPSLGSESLSSLPSL
jgi:uncharacterized membrane protein YedE/YeeE